MKCCSLCQEQHSARARREPAHECAHPGKQRGRGLSAELGRPRQLASTALSILRVQLQGGLGHKHLLPVSLTHCQHFSLR